MTTVTVTIPQEMLNLAGLEGESESSRATKLLALELFREGRVSLGRAAELAGVGIEEFMELAAHRELSLQYAVDDLVSATPTGACSHKVCMLIFAS